MNKGEALKAAIDGAKISNKEWSKGASLKWDGKGFLTAEGYHIDTTRMQSDDWELVKEPLRVEFDCDVFNASLAPDGGTPVVYSLLLKPLVSKRVHVVVTEILE